MDDLVSRQQAIDALIEWYGGEPSDIDCFKELLDELPSAQKKGHWMENHDSDHAWKCSECGCGYTDSKLSFCYDCGADMRGGRPMRRLILVLLVAMMCLLLCGCNKVGSIGGPEIGYYTDRETGVQYIQYKSGYGCAITPRLNPDGSLYVEEVSD